MLTLQTSHGPVTLTKPSGAGPLYHVMIGKWYHGQICKVAMIIDNKGYAALSSTEWRGYLADKSEITEEELKLLVEAVEKAESAKYHP